MVDTKLLFLYIPPGLLNYHRLPLETDNSTRVRIQFLDIETSSYMPLKKITFGYKILIVELT